MRMIANITNNKTAFETVGALVLGLMIGFVSVRISPILIVGLVMAVILLFAVSKILRINVLVVLAGGMIGFGFFAAFYLVGNVHFISSGMYNLVTIVLFLGYGLFLLLPDLKTEMMVFLLLKPFWDYLESKHIFYLDVNEVYFQFEALFILSWFLKYLLVRKKTSSQSSYEFFMFVFFIVLLGTSSLSILFSHDGIRSTNGVIYGVVTPYLLYLIIKNTVTSQDKLFSFLRVFNDILLIHNLFTIFVEYSGQTFFNIVNIYSRATGLFGNSGTVTLLQIFIIPVTLYILDHGKKFDRIVAVVSLFVEIIMVLLTASRAGFVLVLLYFFMYFVFNNRKALKSLMNVVIILPFLYFIFKRFFASSYGVFMIKIASIFTDSSRSSYLEKTTSLVMDRFFSFVFAGVGIDNYYYEYQNSIASEAVYSAHNFFLNMAVEIGLLGTLALFLIFIVSFSYSLSQTDKLKQTVLMIFTGFFVYSMVSGFGLCRLSIEMDVYYIKTNFFSVLFWIAVALNAIAVRFGKEETTARLLEEGRI